MKESEIIRKIHPYHLLKYSISGSGENGLQPSSSEPEPHLKKYPDNQLEFSSFLIIFD
jgi:hypothetical protein